MTMDRVDHNPHLSFLSLSHITWTFIFNYLSRILGNRAFNIWTKRYLIQGSKETTTCNFENNRAQGLVWRIGNMTTISGKGKQCYEIVLTALNKAKRKPVGMADHQFIQ